MEGKEINPSIIVANITKNMSTQVTNINDLVDMMKQEIINLQKENADLQEKLNEKELKK